MKKMIKKLGKLGTQLLIICLSVATVSAATYITIMSINSVTVNHGTTGVVFSDGFENGWDVWTYDSPHRPIPGGGLAPVPGSGPNGSVGSTWALESSIVHGGSYAAQFTLPVGTNIFVNVYKTLGNYYSTLYSSGWFMFDSSIPDGSCFMAGPCICGYNDHDLVGGYIANISGTLKWAMSYYTNGGDDYNFVTSNLGPGIQAGVWYNVQVMVKVANGNGEVEMWVQQGNQFIETSHITGLTNDGDHGPNNEVGAYTVQVGPFIPPTAMLSTQQEFAVTAWYDDTFASTTYININTNITININMTNFYGTFICIALILAAEKINLINKPSKPRLSYIQHKTIIAKTVT
jgi:hypothetical protein